MTDKPDKPFNPDFGTDFQLLKSLVPDIEERLMANTPVVSEIKRRATANERGFRPLHWMQGCL